MVFFGRREVVLFGTLGEMEDACEREEERRTGGIEDCSSVSVDKACVSLNTDTEVGVSMERSVMLAVGGSMGSASGIETAWTAASLGID